MSKKCSVLFFIFILFFSLPLSVHGQDVVNFHFIDVGQGDSTLIETPTNKTILIDGGPPESGEKLVAYLKELQIKSIDLIIATHPDIDHIGGLIDVMKSIPVKQVLDSGKLHTTKTYRKYIKEIDQQNIPLKVAEKNEQIDLDPTVDITILNSFERGKNNNESSIVLKIDYGDVHFLLMSDVERKQEKELLNRHNIQAQFIKIAHHGSKTSSTLDFLKKVDPQVAIITYSKQNDFGHPVPRVIDNINEIGADIYSTAVYGTISIRTDGSSYFIVPEKSPLDGL